MALWLEPSPSGRRCTKQCTTRTPARDQPRSGRIVRYAVGDRLLDFLGELRQPGIRADDRALAFLGDNCGVLGRYKFR